MFSLDNIEKKASVDTQNIDGVMASQVNERPKTLTLPKAVQHQFKRDGYERLYSIYVYIHMDI